jgi:hypothetical protein
MFVSTHGITARPTSSAYGTLTTAWIAATGETDLTILGALNTLETDLTTYGLTSKMKALYPFVGGDASKHSYNFMNTAQYQLTFNGGWTHSSNGSLPNGTNAYANTGFQANTNFSGADNLHLSYYSRTNSNGTEMEIGQGNYLAPYTLLYRTSGTTYYIANGSGTYATASDSDTRAFYIASRNSEGIIRGFKNGTQVATITQTAQALTAFNIYIGAANLSGNSAFYSTKQCGFASLGDGLSSTEAANFYTAVQTFQITLSRNI